jgi:hypothetical protein
MPAGVFLNRFAHFYLVRWIDMGLHRTCLGRNAGICRTGISIDPRRPCLACRGNSVDPADRSLRRPAAGSAGDYERQKRERMSVGHRTQPSRVTFTTETRTTGCHERCRGYRTIRGEGGWAWERVRRLDRGIERRRGARQARTAQSVLVRDLLGRGDIDPSWIGCG